jgi:hypothetical protein
MLSEFGDFNTMRERSRVLMEDRHGLKVIETPEGTIVKFFRQKRLLSSALWDPYAKRFARNAAHLKKLDILSVDVTGVWRISPLKRDAVIYQRLEGQPIRDVEKTDHRVERLASFFAELHAKGVFFRSVHFGNILELPDGRLGLIDMADLTCKGRPLRIMERLRNFAHLVRYPIDRQALETFGLEKFLALYETQSGLNSRRLASFRRKIRKKLELPSG